jgi:hypothetical protein
MIGRSGLWVFLGDSLTEGIGSPRVSWVSQLVPLLRAERPGPVHAVRLRPLDLSSRGDLAHFNLVGNLDLDDDKPGPLWLINLAAESTTVKNDVERSALVSAMKPHRIFILRGPLETIARPRETVSGHWPFWVPTSWRGYAAMDPRCYFSAAIWRRSKQILADRAKQRVRLRLLRKGSEPLLSDDEFLSAYDVLVECLSASGAAITMLALPPVSNMTFPGTLERVVVRNRALADLAARRHVDFLDWPCDLDPRRDGQFCRDGFHPTEIGALEMARFIHGHLMRLAPLADAATNA